MYRFWFTYSFIFRKSFSSIHTSFVALHFRAFLLFDQNNLWPLFGDQENYKETSLATFSFWHFGFDFIFWPILTRKVSPQQNTTEQNVICRFRSFSLLLIFSIHEIMMDNHNFKPRLWWDWYRGRSRPSSLAITTLSLNRKRWKPNSRFLHPLLPNKTPRFQTPNHGPSISFSRPRNPSKPMSASPPISHAGSSSFLLLCNWI